MIVYILMFRKTILRACPAEAARRIERVLTTDPGMGVARHADADYPEAIGFARAHGIKIPMLKPGKS
jgi:urocanate hydratase